MSNPAQVRLTDVERLLLINQLTIRKHLEKSRAYDRHLTILEQGYAAHYGEVLHVLKPDLADDVAGFVSDVLGMYDAIALGLAESRDKRITKHALARFRGFDAKSESAALAYARFLLAPKDAYRALKKRAPDELDAKTPMRTVYAAMLQSWVPSAEASAEARAQQAFAAGEAASRTEG